MFKKSLIFTSVCLLTGTIHASPLKLDNYEAIKQELLGGKAVKAIIDFSKCKLVEGDNGGRSISHTVGLIIENFMISGRSNIIYTSHGFLNSLDGRKPYAVVGYRLGGIAVTPNNDVYVDTAVLTLPAYNSVSPFRLLCKMTEGANFYTSN